MTHNQERWRHPDHGQVVGVEHDWVGTFALWPVKTIGNRWVWLQKIYCRRVWVYYGFADEPDTQYGDLLDILKYNEVQ